VTAASAYEQAIERALQVAPAQVDAFARLAKLSFTEDERAAAFDVARELVVDATAPVPASVAGWIATSVIALRRLPLGGTDS